MRTRQDRHHDRRIFPEPLLGEVTAQHAVQVRDLSVGGARLEHGVVLRPGESCLLRVILQDRPLLLRARIVWSCVVGRVNGLGSPLVFHSGLQFQELPADGQNHLAAFLTGVPAGGASQFDDARYVGTAA